MGKLLTLLFVQADGVCLEGWLASVHITLVTDTSLGKFKAYECTPTACYCARQKQRSLFGTSCRGLRSSGG